MTTTFPLAAVLMQLTCMLGDRNLWLGLQWVPRLSNTEADALTNDDYSLFSMNLRIEVKWEEVPLDVMTSLLLEGQGFLEEINRLKSAKGAEVTRVIRKRKRVKTVKT